MILFEHAGATTIASTPPASVLVFTLFGHPLPDWASAVAIVYTVFLLYVLIRDKIFRDRKSTKK